jgi:hypothetical protein
MAMDRTFTGDVTLQHFSEFESKTDSPQNLVHLMASDFTDEPEILVEGYPVSMVRFIFVIF